MRNGRISTRLVSTALGVALVAGTAVLTSAVADAAPPAGTLGSLTFVPAIGKDTSAIAATTSGPCPSQAVGADAMITGPVGSANPTFPPNNPFPIVTNNKVSFSTTDPFTQQFALILRDAATQRGTVLQAGEFDVTTRCIDRFGNTVFGTFTGALYFTSPTDYQSTDPNGSPTPTPVVTPTPTPVVTPTPTPVVTATPTPVVTPTPTAPPVTPTPSPAPGTQTPVPSPPPGATATTTMLTVLFPGLGDFIPAYLLVNVAPFGANGTVQIFDGNTALGAPVPVSGGIPALVTRTLSPGPHTLTAKFTPADPAAFAPSTSAPQTVTRLF